MIPEGKSFYEVPTGGFICLDCANVTNQAYKGTIAAKNEPKFTPPVTSTAPHLVKFSINSLIFFNENSFNIIVWPRPCLC